MNRLSAYRRVMILVKAGAPVDATIDSLMPLLEAGDIIIDGGNEWCVLNVAICCSDWHKACGSHLTPTVR
jgi:6-phosphogluconate dehydrogenase (decarboxylating)